MPPHRQAVTVMWHFKMTKLYIIITVFFSILIVAGCNYFGALAIAKSATCKVTINENSVKSSCDLINGVFFEKLNVTKSDSSGIPTEYFVTQRFGLFNPGVEGVQKYWPDKIYFSKPNGHYKWRADTVNIKFERMDRNRQMLPIDSSNNDEGMYGFLIFSNKSFDICPIKFSKNSWYYVEVFDPGISSLYLYVDNKMNFTVHKFDSGVSPI